MRRAAAFALAAAASVVAGACTTVTGLPELPASVTAADTGLDRLALAREQAQRLEAPLSEEERSSLASAVSSDPVSLARAGRAAIAHGDGSAGLALIARALEQAPDSLPIGNVFRMEVLGLKLRAFDEARAKGVRMPELPAYLAVEPLATLERVAERSGSREARLQIALAHVDRMVLNPPLEIKAPASIDAAHVLNEILAESPHYVPALYARGLNYLYRPRKLVWPEKPAPPIDAARRDLELAAAAGLRAGTGSPRLESLVLLALGDACTREDKVQLARSWWVLAREKSADPLTLEAVGRRMRWTDEEAADRLEAWFDERMTDLDHPVSDVSFLWNDQARGPA